jgi:hypothetical protein
MHAYSPNRKPFLAQGIVFGDLKYHIAPMPIRITTEIIALYHIFKGKLWGSVSFRSMFKSLPKIIVTISTATHITKIIPIALLKFMNYFDNCILF